MLQVAEVSKWRMDSNLLIHTITSKNQQKHPREHSLTFYLMNKSNKCLFIFFIPVETVRGELCPTIKAIEQNSSQWGGNRQLHVRQRQRSEKSNKKTQVERVKERSVRWTQEKICRRSGFYFMISMKTSALLDCSLICVKFCLQVCLVWSFMSFQHQTWSHSRGAI